MPDTSGPFDGKPWAEAQWYKVAQTWAPDGIMDPSHFPLTASGLTITVGVGRAWVGGAGFERTAPPGTNAVTANSHTTQSRRDRVVLRRSLTTHAVSVVVLQGTPSATPVAPQISQNADGNWDLPLWSFLVPPNNGTTITGLVDERVVNIPRHTFVGTSAPAYAPEGSIYFEIKV